MKILISGHTGLVGSAIVRRLQSSGYANLLLRSRANLDLTDQCATDGFFAAQKPEIVYFCAARVGGISANMTYPADFIYQNISMAANVIRAAQKYGARKLLCFGSACMYPRDAANPIGEDSLLSGPLEPTNEAYAVAKIATVKLCEFFNKQYGTDFLCVTPANLYGSGDNFHMVNGHVLPMLIRRFHLAKLLSQGDYDGLRADFSIPLGGEFDTLLAKAGGAAQAAPEDLERVANAVGAYRDHATVWGSGSVRRQFMHADDLAEACVYLMENCAAKDLGATVNLAPDSDILMRDAIELVRQVVGFSGHVEYDKSKPEGMPRKMLAVTKIHELGWHSRIDLEQGLALAYNSYLAGQHPQYSA